MPLFNLKKGIFKIVIFITTAAEASQNAVARLRSEVICVPSSAVRSSWDRWAKSMAVLITKYFQEFAPISLK